MDYVTKDTALTATADAIREKTGTTDLITWLEELGFSEAIAALKVSDLRAIAGEITPVESTTELYLPYTGEELPFLWMALREDFNDYPNSSNPATLGGCVNFRGNFLNSSKKYAVGGFRFFASTNAEGWSVTATFHGQIENSNGLYLGATSSSYPWLPTVKYNYYIFFLG